MAAVKVLARDWEVAIKSGIEYTVIGGLTSLKFDGEKKDADTTTFDEAGWNTHLVASRGRKLTLEGFYLEETVAGGRDAGQELIEALAEEVGPASVGIFRLTSPGTTVQYFKASANVTGIGGGNDDPTGWSAELTLSGKPSSIEIV